MMPMTPARRTRLGLSALAVLVAMLLAAAPVLAIHCEVACARAASAGHCSNPGDGSSGQDHSPAGRDGCRHGATATVKKDPAGLDRAGKLLAAVVPAPQFESCVTSPERCLARRPARRHAAASLPLRAGPPTLDLPSENATVPRRPRARRDDGISRQSKGMEPWHSIAGTSFKEYSPRPGSRRPDARSRGTPARGRRRARAAAGQFAARTALAAARRHRRCSHAGHVEDALAHGRRRQDVSHRRGARPNGIRQGPRRGRLGLQRQRAGADDRGQRRRPGAHRRREPAARDLHASTGTASRCRSAWTASPV